MDTTMTNVNATETTTMAVATAEPVAVVPAQPTQAEVPAVRTEDTVSRKWHKREIKKTKITYGMAGAAAGVGGTLLVTKGIPALWRWGKAKVEAGKIKREQAKAANANQANPEPAPVPENGNAQQTQANNQQASTNTK